MQHCFTVFANRNNGLRLALLKILLTKKCFQIFKVFLFHCRAQCFNAIKFFTSRFSRFFLKSFCFRIILRLFTVLHSRFILFSFHCAQRFWMERFEKVLKNYELLASLTLNSLAFFWFVKIFKLQFSFMFYAIMNGCSINIHFVVIAS